VIDRIAILGGSSVYIPEFIVSLTSHNINVREVVLHGRPGDKLPIVADFCRRLVKRSGFPMEIHHTTEVEEAAENATYVLNHIRVGGMQARLRDEKLPPREGMVGDESVGAGGLGNALRTLPTIFEHAARIEAVNPDCVYLNLTNPLGIVVEALTAHSGLNVVGVCDLPATYHRKIAALLRRNPGEIYLDYIGLNHMGWVQDVRMDGSSLMTNLLDLIDEHRPDGFDIDLIRLFRMVPTRAVSLYFHADRVVEEQKRQGKYRAEVLQEAEQQILEQYRDPHVFEIPPETRARNTPWYEETLVPLIQSLQREDPETRVLCVRNEGAIRDLPKGSSVEIPVDVSSQGFHPQRVGNCPRFLCGLFGATKESERLIVEAVYHKSYEYALQAFAVNPFVPSMDTAKRYLDRIIKNEKLELH